MWQVKSLTFCLAHLFPVKPQVCNAGANCSNPNLILCKIAFVSLVTVDIVNSISRTVVNIIVLCKGPSGLVTKLNNKKKTKKNSAALLIKLDENKTWSIFIQHKNVGNLPRIDVHTSNYIYGTEGGFKGKSCCIFVTNILT